VVGEPGRRRLAPTATEIVLLAIGLVGLAFAAGIGGWAIGHGTRASEARTVTVAGTTASEVRTVTVAGTTTTGGAPKAGAAAAGKKVFVNAGCGSCHTLEAADASGTVGPNLDRAKLSSAAFIDWIANGKGAMPPFKGQLSKKEIEDVSAFLGASTSGK
jgi:Cytochrome c.